MEWLTDSHWLQTETEIHTKPSRVFYVLPNGMEIGKVELILLEYLSLGPLLVFLIPAIILWREKRQRAVGQEKATAERKMDKLFLRFMSLAFVFTLGIAHLMGSIVLEDIRRFVAYEKTSCTLLDKRIVLKEGRSSSRGEGLSQTSMYNQPLVAVRYQAEGGCEIIASGSPRPYAMLSTSEKSALRELARYERGSVYSCWYDPQKSQSFVLVRGVSLGWYLLGVGPMVMLFILGRYFLRRLRG